MASLSHSETRRLYSWWWDSHIPKNSKWLQENLTDMDVKVKAMIKLIEEDADSFARRAEMYYKKRPELMKMVEEFYRAYRALAERHDHLTGELRHAQRTIATAFPNQELLPFELDEDSPARSDVNLKAMDSSESDLGIVKAEDEEIHDLKKAIADFQAEKDTIFLQYQICLEKLSRMETDLVRAENESLRVREQKDRAESEVETMKQVLASLEVEKEDALAQLTDLQGIISHTETESQCLIESISRIESEKEVGIHTYKLCLEKISYLENKISLAEEDIKMFKEKTVKAENEAIKLKKLLAELTVEKEYTDFQYKNCVKRISYLETELARALEDVKRLKTQVQIEAMRRNNSEEKSQSLTQEADDLTQKIAVKDLETSRKHTELENEILYLKMMKSRLEEEVLQQAGQTNSLQKEVSSLSEEIDDLNEHYRDLLKKLESVGLNPDTIETSVKNLMNENSNLKQISENESIEKKVSKNRNVFERSISQLNNQLEETQKTNQFLLGEKSVLFAEKATLFTQLQTLTENMQKALVNNAVLENSLSVAKIELEGLREKSKGLEEICHLLKNEKSDLLTQRETLIVQLANVEGRTVHMEIKYVNLEERYTDLKIMNKRLESEIQDLTLSLNSEKLERTKSVHRYETLLVNAEQRIHCLQVENKRRKNEYEDELEKSVTDEFELFILRNFIRDMETKNRSLLIGCQKYVESSKLAEKMISDLERENLEEDMEAKLLIDEIEKLRFGICLIFKVLESGSGNVNVSNQQVLVHQIIEIIEDMKRSIAKYKDEKRLLEVENGVLSTLLNQIALEGTEINSKMELLEEGKMVKTEKLEKIQTEKKTLLETNELLKSRLALMQTDLSAKHCDIEKDYLDLLENHFQLLDENSCLFQECSALSAEKCLLEEENDSLLLETLTSTFLSTVLESFAYENSLELSTMDEVLYDLTETKDELEKDKEILQGKLETKEEDNMFLEDVVQSFKLELLGLKDALRQKENELFESELKFQIEEKINLELTNTLDMLKTRFQESSLEREAVEYNLLVICEDKNIQQNKIEGLQVVNAKLCAELEAKDAEFELWDAEASVFYFDHQVLSVQEVLHENTVHELTETCGNLKDETVSKSREIQEMKGKLIRMESEIRDLKADSSAYEPIIASLMDDVTSLEHSALLHTKLLMLPDDFETKSAGSDSNLNFEDNPTDDDDKLTVRNGIQDLGKLQLRINVVEKTIIEEIKKLVVQESPKAEGGGKHTTVMNIITELKPHGGFIHRKAKEKKDFGRNLNENVKLFDVKTEALASRKVISMKDIPLDQISESFSKKTTSCAMDRVDGKVLEMRETMHSSGVSEVEKELGIDKLEVSSSNLGGESKEATKTMKILERLASDARRLTVLQFEVENLNKKLDSNKKLRKVKDVDLDTIKDQLQEVQETVCQLVEFNGKLIGSVVETPLPKDEVSEQACKGSEKIKRLQIELQKIEYMLLKLDDEKKGRFSRNRTDIILRDFVYNGRKNSAKKRKSRLCGCFKSSSNREQIRM